MPYRPMLAAHLWDLRAQMEAQLRALTEVQRVIETPTFGNATVEVEVKRQILANLQAILRSGAIVTDVTTAALEIANAEQVF